MKYFLEDSRTGEIKMFSDREELVSWLIFGNKKIEELKWKK